MIHAEHVESDGSSPFPAAGLIQGSGGTMLSCAASPASSTNQKQTSISITTKAGEGSRHSAGNLRSLSRAHLCQTAKPEHS